MPCVDNDACLAAKPAWGAGYTCESAGAGYCDDVTWQSDMHECCPDFCGVCPSDVKEPCYVKKVYNSDGTYFPVDHEDCPPDSEGACFE